MKISAIIYLFLFAIIETFCTTSSSTIKPTRLSLEIDSTSYYYYYSNYPSYDCEDNIIEFLYKNGEVVDGYFWGTSDEFRDAREGFYPGFFVLRLEQISNKNDSIVFTLDSRNTQYFSAPVSISYHSSDEALKHGYHPWIQNDKFFQDCISFCGTFQNDNFILHKEKSKYSHIVDRHFVRISLDSLKNIEYQCSFEEENRAIVFATAKILIRKQFTTDSIDIRYRLILFLPLQRY